MECIDALEKQNNWEIDLFRDKMIMEVYNAFRRREALEGVMELATTDTKPNKGPKPGDDVITTELKVAQEWMMKQKESKVNQIRKKLETEKLKYDFEALKNKAIEADKDKVVHGGRCESRN